MHRAYDNKIVCAERYIITLLLLFISNVSCVKWNFKTNWNDCNALWAYILLPYIHKTNERISGKVQRTFRFSGNVKQHGVENRPDHLCYEIAYLDVFTSCAFMWIILGAKLSSTHRVRLTCLLIFDVTFSSFIVQLKWKIRRNRNEKQTKIPRTFC